MQPSKHSAIQAQQLSFCSRILRTISLIAWMIATKRLPRQIEPKEYVYSMLFDMN
jgi:hypothetical protein